MPRVKIFGGTRTAMITNSTHSAIHFSNKGKSWPAVKGLWNVFQVVAAYRPVIATIQTQNTHWRAFFTGDKYGETA